MAKAHLQDNDNSQHYKNDLNTNTLEETNIFNSTLNKTYKNPKFLDSKIDFKVDIDKADITKTTGFNAFNQTFNLNSVNKISALVSPSLSESTYASNRKILEGIMRKQKGIINIINYY